MNDASARSRLRGTEAASADPAVLERILFKTRDGLKFIEVEGIDWIEGTDYYVNLHCGSKSHLYRESLKSLLTKLPSMRFVRVHKSAIVNLKSIERISTESRSDMYVILKSGQSIKVSRRRRKMLMELFEEKFGLKNR